ncbi:flavin monoamine oxidase family protein [Variovorax ginsengisoli]|uniref:Monoamine oxidase n=1 Tax=Variovorax ginsengisoli TaxID=363844 RepID=A0ABT9SHA9_9BURK|nr:FAD-dependent oxidoreductase [Variovorax ginsengisoli]MDP9902782.1 monoamine oxidase [Variovorax ginsengisoli]
MTGTVVPMQVDVAIVGAGLCGLALARTLTQRGLSVCVLEARSRMGGRVLTQRCADTGQALDLGPAWFWPATEPRIAALLDALGLASGPQHDPGDALWLTDPNRQPERRLESGGVHAGAHRIDGGTDRLVTALAAGLPEGCVHTDTAVRGVRDHGAFLELRLAAGPSLRARRVVLAVPPRLVRERVQFDPPLPDTVAQALEATPTWMATQAKVLTTFERPFWRAEGQSGNAFVRHAQAVLGEVFDASDKSSGAMGAGPAGALGGFFALNAAQRQDFQRGLPMLIDSQLAQLFGPQAQHGHQHRLDWAEEPWTCSATDRAFLPEPPQADPMLRRPLWGGRLFMGGSETAAHGAGHMEGALEAADRIARAIGGQAVVSSGLPEPARPASRSEALAAFAASVQAQRRAAPERYRLHLTRLLSSQQAEQLTQRALLATADQVYSETLVGLDRLLPALDAGDAAAERGRHALTATLLAPFDGWNQGLLDAALDFNRTSCALSNFPLEHRPDPGTLRAATLDLAAAWREFAFELNTRLMSVVDSVERT